MNQPDFWYQPTGGLAVILTPVSWLVAQAARLRLRYATRSKSPIPAISVGNLVVGGTGKTPLALALGSRLLEAGARPHFITRGYGGRTRGTELVDVRKHDARLVGDEALLLSSIAPTWVSRNRATAASRAADQGATVVILDDAHQNTSLAPDYSFITVDAFRGFGNGKVMPAGPLRETLSSGLSRADATIVIGEQEARDRVVRTWQHPPGSILLNAELKPLATGLELEGARVVAFAGIGNPEKFRRTLVRMGAEICEFIPLADHQPLGVQLMTRLETKARAKSAQLVTTEKDAARLPQALRNRVLSVPVRLKLEDWTTIDRELTRIGALGQH